MKEFYNALIVDDEVHNTEMVEFLVKKYFPEIKIIGVAHNIQDALDYFKTETIDIAFLDIKLHNKNIFDLFRSNDNFKFNIIFISAFENYALKAINKNPIDYLLKPLDTELFIKAVNKAKKSCDQKVLLDIQATKQEKSRLEPLSSVTQAKITISSKNELRFLSIGEIIHLRAERQYTIFTLVSGEEIVSSHNIGNSLKSIKSSLLIRIHKSHAININHLIKINKNDGNYCELSNGDKLSIAKRKYKELIAIITSNN